MKKILILETAAFKGGREGGSFFQAEYYTKLLRQKGYRVEFFIGDSYEKIYKKAWKVMKEIREADYVLGFGTPLLDFYLQWLCFFFRKRGIFCIDTIIVPISIIRDHLKRRIFSLKIIFSFLKKILYDKLFIRIVVPPKLNLVNLASCEYVKEKLIYSPFKPLDNQYVYPRVYLKRNITKQTVKGKSVLFYGALYRGRGVIDVVRACSLLWERGFDFKLLIFGYPVDHYTKMTLVQKINRDLKKYIDRIVLKEKIDEIRKYIEKVSVVVLPFRYPCAFQPPLTILEPMGIRIPVITTDVGEHSRWIIDEITGLICKKEDIKDIAAKIEMVFKDNVLVRKITQNAYKLLEKRYKEKDLLLEILKKLEDER